MKNLYKIILIILTILFIVPLNAIKAKEEITPYVWHEQSSIIEKNFNKTLSIATDYKNYNHILPYIDKIQVISSRGLESICYLEHFEFGQTFWMKLRFKVVKYEPNNFLILKTIYMDGNAHPYESEIILENIENSKTKITGRMKIQYPGPTFIPDSIINDFIDEFLKKSLQNLNKL